MSDVKLDLILSKLDKLDTMEVKLNVVEATLNNLESKLSSRMNDFEEALYQQKRAIEILERKVRRNNLLFFGIPEEERDLMSAVRSTINRIPGFSFTQDQIDAVYRLGKIVREGRSRPIVVEFASYKWKEKVFSMRKALPENCGVYVKLDLPAGLRKKTSSSTGSPGNKKRPPPGTPSPESKPPYKKPGVPAP
ncbi:Hypothetical protein NTJ_07304 [Nesidiocoris tenuis]|uniref:L1 transposable element RRM domain-containing protein n=1 Tax=Nesidiocoris tenuis TaxID=355587 RepID=A0ABN7AJ80_9HEMI|nr:Hypothetical protein NTJ_03738 [Nesidiocoris tenuis]BES94495.1 Hypothetical protein NTJ_07304 [Nesidiocoris tenuis]